MHLISLYQVVRDQALKRTSDGQRSNVMLVYVQRGINFSQVFVYDCQCRLIPVFFGTTVGQEQSRITKLYINLSLCLINHQDNFMSKVTLSFRVSI